MITKRKTAGSKSPSKQVPIPKGCLLAIGGKESKGDSQQTEDQKRNVDFESEEILKFFKEKLKGKNPTVAFLPTATTEPEAVAKEYVRLFNELGLSKVKVLDIRSRDDTQDEEYLKVIEQADGIYFSGGDQLRLTSILGGTKLLQLMKERFTYDNVLVAGTSAGATALSTPMIYEVMSKGGFIKGDVRITTGLEFLKNIAVDTHFIQRGRLVRMAQCIVTNPGCIGLGLEEDTAAYITEGKDLTVIGSGLVTIVEGMKMVGTNIYDIEAGEPFSAKGLTVHLLSHGEKYTFPIYDQLHI
ncbi:cyanophycinase [Pontibacter cellulosilyticus]|uniref:Cyanophycinase n=1 Tax=Pontibacter cellulosilyticus TaxID=1720253 RepID=A0A923SHQ8_9BACT|nr:cyanophycinase [Pontibacter cellulosilyticus]MBC5992004.1 cyanophycinase [Pontibacter cellulosilyticus]